MFGKKKAKPEQTPQDKPRMDVQEIFKQNLKYISQTEASPEAICGQFVKTQTRYFLTVGMADFPSGRVVAADPLAYLPSGKMCPECTVQIPAGTYPVEVSICRNPEVGLRMCTVRLKIKQTPAVKYECAIPTGETAVAKSADGVMSGIPVDAGMVTLCDAVVAEEFRTFLGNWHQDNPGKNHYDDYFAAYFAKSAERLPAYQRSDGDFIEWTNPDTNHKLVMVASGFGDGFYQSYLGYDTAQEICEIIIPLVNPDLFDF